MLEDKFLEKLIKEIEPLKYGEIGIGDDSAFIFTPEGSILITQDSFSEGKHFPSSFPLHKIIKRTIRASLSDINAMGGKGKYLICSLGLKKKNAKELNKILIKIKEDLNFFNLKLLGGDTVSSDKNFITITVLGFLPAGKKPLLRSGAKPGENIYISGPIGKSGLSIELINGKKIKVSEEKKRELIDFFCAPEIPYPLGEELLLSGKVNCCMDISDGLSIDLHRICRRSNCGAIIYEENIPFLEDLLKIFPQKNKRTDFLLSSGEEFKLLFTSQYELNFPKIGKIIEDKNIYIKKENKKIKMKISGFDHFKK